MDEITLSKWLINYGTVAQMLQKKAALWIELICNESPLWAIIHVVTSARMCTFDKQQGVRHVEIGGALQ